MLSLLLPLVVLGGGLGLARSSARAAEPVAEPEYSGSPLVRAWTPAEYGGHAQNWAVYPAANGLVYVANNRGVLEFDGVSWRVIELPGGIPARSLIGDARGRIWVGASDMICVLEPNAVGALQARAVTNGLVPGVEALGTFFWALPEDGGRGLVFVSDGLAVHIGDDGKPRVIASGASPGRGFSWEGGVPLVRFGPRPGAFQFGLVRNGRFESMPGLAGLALTQCTPDGEGGLMLFGLNDWSRWRDGVESPRKPLPGLTANDAVRAAVALDGTRRFAVGTLRGGVLVVDRGGRLLERWSRADGLPDSSVRAMATDRQGGLWLALNNGVARLQVESPVRFAGAGRGVDQGVSAVLGDAAGRLWVGGSQGVMLRDRGASRFALAEDLPVDVFGLAPEANGTVLIAGRGLKTARGGRALPTQVDRTSTATGMPIFLAGGSIVAVPESQGVGLYSRQGEGWSQRTALGGVTGTVMTLALSEDGWLWLVRDGREVMQVRAGDASILTATAEALGAAAGAEPKTRQRRKIVAWGGAIWLAGEDGLTRWDASSGRFVEPAEVPPEWRRTDYQRPFALADGGLWLERHLEDEGDRRLALLRLSWVDGQMVAREVNVPSLTRINPQSLWLDPWREQLWVGGFGGLARLDLSGGVGHELTAPAAVLRRIVAGGREIFGGQRQPADETLRLRVGESSLRLEFAAPWYPADQRGDSPLRWRSRLLGFDGDWSSWSGESRRDYTNLPPGEYVVQVQARAWGEPGPVDAFPLTLPPPWWRTWWAMGGAGLLVLGAVVTATREWSQRALRRRVARLEAQAAIEQERLRIARDMHDDLGSSLGRVTLLSERGMEHLEDASATRDVLRRIRETARDLSASTRDIIWAVNPQNDTLVGTLDHLSSWVEGTLGDAGVRCFVDLPPDIPARPTGSQRRHALLLAVKEATQNLVKYAEASEAHFAATISADRKLTLTLRDNGRGFAPGEVRGTGHGVASIAARLAGIGGSGKVESQPGQGTTVTLIVEV